MAGRATSPYEGAIALFAGLAVLVSLWRGPDPEPPTVVTRAPVVPPPPATFVAAPAATAMAAAPVPATGYRLRGVIARPGSAASAIVEAGDGRQRLVRVGSQLAPGLVVIAIDATGLTLAGAGGNQSLDFGDRRPETSAATASAAPETTGGAALATLAASVSDYRTGLDPRKIGGLTRGFTLVDASRLPLFRNAGLQAGDIILMVNGTAIDSEEKVMELPAEVNGARAVEILYERNGKRKTAQLAIAR